jgi:hypothetical protein
MKKPFPFSERVFRVGLTNAFFAVDVEKVAFVQIQSDIEGLTALYVGS